MQPCLLCGEDTLSHPRWQMISVFSCEFEFKSHWSSARVYSGSNELKIAFNLNFKTRGEGGMGGEGGREGAQQDPSSQVPLAAGPAAPRRAAELKPRAWCKGKSIAGQQPSLSLKINVSLSGSKQTLLLCILQATCSEEKDSSGYLRSERQSEGRAGQREGGAQLFHRKILDKTN